MDKTTAHGAKHRGSNGTGMAVFARVRDAAHRAQEGLDRLRTERPAVVVAAAAGVGFGLGIVFGSSIARHGVAFSTGYFVRDLLGKSGIAEELKRAVMSVVAGSNRAGN
ncbi:MAG TPA: hypothetical protein VKU41_22260 [Polyangiaceae bacterium]|nr:hypothetical protein [Polyangiaceae bacterium]